MCPGTSRVPIPSPSHRLMSLNRPELLKLGRAFILKCSNDTTIRRSNRCLSVTAVLHREAATLGTN